MDELNKNRSPADSGQNASGQGTKDATGSPGEPGLMDEGMHQARGRAETVAATPAGTHSGIEDADVHGADTGAAGRGGANPESSATAREGAAKAFPPSSDSEYLKRG